MELIHDFKEHGITGLAINSDDTLFIADYSTKSIDRVLIDKEGKVSITKGPITSQFNNLCALAFDKDGDLFVGMEGKIMKMSKEGNVFHFIGNGERENKDGERMNVQQTHPYGICFDESGFAYFCDSSNNSIQKVTPEGKVSTICGSGNKKRGYEDGKGNEALFHHPFGIVYNKFTKIFYITDYGNNKIRTMTLDGTVGTLCRYSARLDSIAINEKGNLYVHTRNEGIITVNSKGEIKQIPNTKVSFAISYGMAFNSKGDLFFTTCEWTGFSEYLQYTKGKLFMIRKSLLPSFSQINSNFEEKKKEEERIKTLKEEQMRKKAEDLKRKQEEEFKILKQKEKESQGIRKEGLPIEEKEERKKQEVESKIKKQKEDQVTIGNDNISLVNPKEETKSELYEEDIEDKEEEESKELTKWLRDLKLREIESIIREELGVSNLQFLSEIEEKDLNGLQIKPIPKKILLKEIQKLKNSNSTSSPSLHNDVHL